MGQDNDERIRQRAHAIWESEGRPEGRDADHWTRAQEELKSELGDSTPSAEEPEPELAQTADPAPKPKKRTRKTAAAESPKDGPDAFLHEGP